MNSAGTLDLRETKPCRHCGSRRQRIISYSTPNSVTFCSGCRDCGTEASYIHIDGMMMGFRVNDVPMVLPALRRAGPSLSPGPAGMSVYVDGLMGTEWADRSRWPYSQSCHLYADTLEELHAFAAQITLQKAWFQDKPGFPHYDLTASKRAWAVRLGAVEHDRRQFVDWLRARRALESVDAPS